MLLTINLTRGQDALIMEAHQTDATGTGTIRVDFSTLDLAVLMASRAELGAHEGVLKEIDKASGGKTVLRL